jgi:hypothetical protein
MAAGGGGESLQAVILQLRKPISLKQEQSMKSTFQS